MSKYKDDEQKPKAKSAPRKRVRKKAPRIPPELHKKPGRPTYKIDYNILDNLCKLFCTGEECAGVLGVSYAALNRALERDGHGGFVEYFKNTSSHTKAALRRKQLDVALKKEDVQMLKHLGNQYLGQSDKSEATLNVETEVKIGLDSLYEDVGND